MHVIRPLLQVSRSEIESYLKSVGQTWREDSSNADRRFVRNRIRHDLLPLLQRDYNSQVAESLARLAEHARRWQRAALHRIARHIREIELPRAGATVILNRAAIEALPAARLTAFWRQIWEREGWPCQDMGTREYNRIADWCRANSSALELPGGIRLTRREKTIVAGPMTNDPPMPH